MNSVQWIKERTSTTLGLIRTNPVSLRDDRMRQTSIQHLALPKSTPTKYRRPSEGRRDSFGGGSCRNASPPSIWHEATLIDGINITIFWGDGESCWVLQMLRATFKAISRRYPLTGDCFDGDANCVFLTRKSYRESGPTLFAACQGGR